MSRAGLLKKSPLLPLDSMRLSSLYLSPSLSAVSHLSHPRRQRFPRPRRAEQEDALRRIDPERHEALRVEEGEFHHLPELLERVLGPAHVLVGHVRLVLHRHQAHLFVLRYRSHQGGKKGGEGRARARGGGSFNGVETATIDRHRHSSAWKQCARGRQGRGGIRWGAGGTDMVYQLSTPAG